jgi:hypothetical protein
MGHVQEDTPDAIALEIGEQFSLSDADRDICAAALKEWLGNDNRMPDCFNDG